MTSQRRVGVRMGTTSPQARLVSLTSSSLCAPPLARAHAVGSAAVSRSGCGESGSQCSRRKQNPGENTGALGEAAAGSASPATLDQNGQPRFAKPDKNAPLKQRTRHLHLNEPSPRPPGCTAAAVGLWRKGLDQGPASWAPGPVLPSSSGLTLSTRWG